MDEQKKFWMVLGARMPVHRHSTKLSAKQEAERLARSHPNTEFVVLESMGTVMRSDVTWKRHEPIPDPLEDDAPF